MKLASKVLVMIMAGISVVALPAGEVQAQEIAGAGATFPAPVYPKWAEAAKSAIGVELNYQAIGSGGGQNQILNRTVDFGASDAPMEPIGSCSPAICLQFPTVMGAAGSVVNPARRQAGRAQAHR